MNPTEQQLANRLNPQATNVYTPQAGIFRASGDVYGTQPIIYKRTPTGLQTFDLTSLLSEQERKTAGGAGAQWELARSRAQQQYGFDFGSLTQANLGDVYSQMGKSGLGYNNPDGAYVAPQTASTNINDFIQQQQAQLQQQAINNTPNTLSPDAQQPVNNGIPTVQPSTPQGSAMSQPNAAVGTPTGAPTTQPSQTYTIQKDDTLGKLALQYGTTVGALQSLNPQITDPNKIYTGQKINLTPAITQQPQGGLKGTDEAPDAMVQEANRIQAEIDRLKSPANTGTFATPETANGQTEAKNFGTLIKEAMTELGTSQTLAKKDKIIEDQRAMQNELDDAIAEVNNNPWYSQGKRDMEISKLNKRYETKLNTLSNYAKYYEAQYESDMAQARFMATGMQEDQQFAINTAIKQQEAADALLASSQKLDSGIVGEYQYAQRNGYTGSFSQYQNEDANRKATIAKAGAATTILPSTQDLTSKATSEALQTVNDINTILTNSSFDKAFGALGLARTLIPGTSEYTLDAQVTQVKNKLALAARGALKGQGAVSNFEAKMLTDAQTNLRTGMAPADARQELTNIQGALTTSTGGQAKVRLTEKDGTSYTVMADSRGITRAIADGLSVKYTQ